MGINSGPAVVGNFGSAERFSYTAISDHVIKLNSSFDLDATTKLYATYSEGFRRGGANALPTTGYVTQQLSSIPAAFLAPAE